MKLSHKDKSFSWKIPNLIIFRKKYLIYKNQPDKTLIVTFKKILINILEGNP